MPVSSKALLPLAVFLKAPIHSLAAAADNTWLNSFTFWKPDTFVVRSANRLISLSVGSKLEIIWNTERFDVPDFLISSLYCFEVANLYEALING